MPRGISFRSIPISESIADSRLRLLLRKKNNLKSFSEFFLAFDNTILWDIESKAL